MIDGDKLEAFITEFKAAFDGARKKPQNLRDDDFPWIGSGGLNPKKGCVYCHGDVEWGWGPSWHDVYRETKQVFERFGFQDPASIAKPGGYFCGTGCWTLDKLVENVKQQMEAQEKSQP